MGLSDKVHASLWTDAPHAWALSYLSDLFGKSLRLLLTIPDVAFPWAHLLEVQYNAFEDKDNMLFIVFMCFVLDLTAKM